MDKQTYRKKQKHTHTHTLHVHNTTGVGLHNKVTSNQIKLRYWNENQSTNQNQHLRFFPGIPSSRQLQVFRKRSTIACGKVYSKMKAEIYPSFDLHILTQLCDRKQLHSSSCLAYQPAHLAYWSFPRLRIFSRLRVFLFLNVRLHFPSHFDFEK